MSGFSIEWLKLREPADARARNSEVAQAASAWFGLRDQISVVDLGCGTGSNLRATAPFLPAKQDWTLIDHDPALLNAARAELSNWADTTRSEADTLILTKGAANITVHLVKLDLAQDPVAALASGPDLVTASAFFDLVSEAFMSGLARALTDQRAAFYAVLTYNGVERWNPHRPADNQVTAAFLRHQMRDKGFGPAAGPMAASHLVEQFRLNGYTVVEGGSPWELGVNDRSLIEELISGHAMAVLETKAVDAATVASWVKVKRAGAIIGHSDMFAVPV